MNIKKKFFDQYTVAGLTDTGCIRQNNEDNILLDESLRFLLVADGMGGHQAGELASMEAIMIIQKMLLLQQNIAIKSSISSLFSQHHKASDEIEVSIQHLEKAIQEANNHIFQLNIERNLVSGTGMGTTIAGCWLLTPELMLVFHIGDSRIYRFRNQQLEALSKDHSILQEWSDAGCIGEKPSSNIILNAVGPYPATKPEIKTIAIENKDSFLICSDGLTDMVEDLDIAKTLQGIKSEQIEDYCKKLLESALEQGGRDNISIILLTQS